MAHYTGQDLYIRYISSGGTVVINTDYRSLTVNYNQNTADTTAGADEWVSAKPTTKAMDVSVEFISGNDATARQLRSIMLQNQEGTLEWGIEGTATGAPKEVWPVIWTSMSDNESYDAEVTHSVAFMGNGPYSSSYYFNDDTY